jgi:hypothetical protein
MTAAESYSSWNTPAVRPADAQKPSPNDAVRQPVNKVVIGVARIDSESGSAVGTIILVCSTEGRRGPGKGRGGREGGRMPACARETLQ